MNMSEALHTLAAFAEMLDIVEGIEGWFGRKGKLFSHWNTDAYALTTIQRLS